MDAQQIQSITILGRKWFNTTYGNTYFSAVALVNGEEVLNTPHESGYDSDYEWDTWRQLVNLYNLDVKRYPQTNTMESAWSYCERKGIAYYNQVTRVARKKDL